MVCGTNVASCLHCGREWLVGDAVPTVCEACWGEGHGRDFPCSACARRISRLGYAAELHRARLEQSELKEG